MDTNKPTITVVLTGGGSGGHITPLLSLARALKLFEPTCRVVYIGLRGEKIGGLAERFQVFDEIYYVPAGKFRRYHGESLLAHLVDVRTMMLNVRDFFRVIRGIFSARRILKQIGPDVVFSKGGFVAVPVGIASRLLHVPIVTHDSDSLAGLANRIVGRWAVVHATGMPADGYSYPKKTIRYVGIPVDERIKPVSLAAQADFKRQIGAGADEH